MAISYLLVGEDYANWYVLKDEVEDPQSLDTFDVLAQEGISILPYDSTALSLAELEDKIEDGTLVELPCKVGDTIYEVFKNHKPPFIQQTKVEKIIITEKGLKLKLARNSVYETSIASLGKTLFLTEAKALKKLKEVEQTI